MQSKFERLLAKNSHFLTRGHDFVEIGGLKWATCNVGAEKPTDFGLYFAWGETKGYTADDVCQCVRCFNRENYKFGYGVNLSKYNGPDGKLVLDPENDPVHTNWGGKWRVPTTEEFIALGAAVNTVWTNDYQNSGVSGLVLTDKTDPSKVLFFPAAGFCVNGSVYYVGSSGSYCSGSLNDDDVDNADQLDFDNGRVYWDYYSDRSVGYPVRGVVG
jgi:hypothetical protein